MEQNKSKQYSIKKNFMYNGIYQILIMLFPLITMPYISRIIGVEGVGIYTYTYSIAGYFVLFAMLGISSYGNRTIAQVRDNKEKLSREFSSLYSLQIIISLLVNIIYSIYVLTIVKENQIFAIIQIIYVLSAMFDVSWFFHGMEEFKTITIKNFIIKLITVTLIFTLVKAKEDLLIYSIIMVSSILVSNLLLTIFVRKYTKFTMPKIREIKKHIKPCLILFLPVIASGLFRIIDKIMLGKMINMTEIGYYEYAEKIINIPDTIITALSIVAMPRIANMISSNKYKESKEQLGKSMHFAMMCAVPIWLGIYTVADNFIPIFLGTEFSETSSMLKILSFSIPLFMWGNVIRMQYLIPNEKDKQYTKSVLIGVISNIILNFILIPKYYGDGAALATVASEIITLIVQVIGIRKNVDVKLYFSYFIKFLVTGLIMYITINMLQYSINDRLALVISQIILGIIMYALLNYKEIIKHFK